MIEHLRMWDRRSSLGRNIERNFKKAFEELSSLASKLNVSSIAVERAAYIYRKAVKLSLSHWRSIPELVAASLYAACRDTETQRTIEEIASLLERRNRRSLARTYRLIRTRIDLRVPVVDPKKCLARIVNKAKSFSKVVRNLG